MVCRSENFEFLKHVSDWHRTNFVISGADNNMFLKVIVFEVALHLLLKNKQTNKKQMQLGLTFGLFAHIFMLQDFAFNMQLRNDDACTMPI